MVGTRCALCPPYVLESDNGDGSLPQSGGPSQSEGAMPAVRRCERSEAIQRCVQVCFVAGASRNDGGANRRKKWPGLLPAIFILLMSPLTAA
jgi:hypothetical protein